MIRLVSSLEKPESSAFRLEKTQIKFAANSSTNRFSGKLRSHLNIQHSHTHRESLVIVIPVNDLKTVRHGEDNPYFWIDAI